MPGPSSYLTASPALQVAALAAGAALVLAGLAAATQDRTRRLGILALLAALAWLGPELEGWATGPAVVRSLAVMTAPLLLVVLVALAGAPRPVVVAVGTAAAATALCAGLLRSPFLDVYCWRTCGGNALLIHAMPDLAHAVWRAWTVAVVIVGMGVAAVAARRLQLPLAAAGLAVAAYAVALLIEPLETPRASGFEAVYYARAASLLALAGWIGWTAVQVRRRRARIARLAAELGAAPAPGRLRDALAAALRDPGLDVLYWLPGDGRFVDAEGVAREPAGATTRIMRGGRLVAVVVHAPRAGRELEREIGSAARMAVENEALRAQVLAQLGELRASRGRIIEAGDAARRQLERNLHDGAQQRLLAVGFQLRLAGSRADPANAPTLEHADAEVSAAFDELRELAHGIFPAVLTEAGLEAALTQLAIAAPVAVEVDEAPVERLPAPVETSAYIAAAEAVRDAAERGAARVVLSARRTSDALVVVVEDDGMRRNGGLVHVADRVGALGGRLALAPTRVEAEIPCAS